MLVWSKSGRGLIWAFLALLVGVVYIAPLAIILAASFAGQWNGVLPSKPTLEHFASALTGDSGDQLRVSIITGIVASSFALVVGTWSALTLRTLPRIPRRILDLVILHSERGAVRLGRFGTSGCVQPAAHSVERHRDDRLHRPFHPDLGVHLRQCLGRSGAACRRISNKWPKVWGRGRSTGCAT